MARPEAPRRLRRIPGALFVVTVLLSLAVREWYPFSPFPMYAVFGPETWYVVVTDGADRLVPTQRFFGVSATPLKRTYELRMLAHRGRGAALADAEALAAQATLRAAAAHAPAGAPTPPAQLRLWRVRARAEGTQVERTSRLLGEVRLR